MRILVGLVLLCSLAAGALCAQKLPEKNKDAVLAGYQQQYWAAMANAKTDSALFYLDQVLARAVEIHDRRSEGGAYQQKINVYAQKGNTAQAATEGLKALKIGHALNDSDLIVTSLMSMGEVYLDFAEYQRALKSFNELIPFIPQANCKHRSQVYNDMANAYASLNEGEKAIEALQQALNYTGAGTKEYVIATNNLALMYSGFGKCEQAMEMINRSIAAAKQGSYTQNLAVDYVGLASVYLDCYHKPQEAINCLDTYCIHNKYLDARDKFLMYELYRDAYDKLGKPAMVLEYYKKWTALKDSLNNVTKAAQFNELEAKYKSEKKQHDIDVLEADKIRQQQKTRYAYAGMGCAVLLLGGMIVAFRSNRRYTRLLAKEKERKDLLLQEVHHRINNSLQMISVLLSMQASNTTNEETSSLLLQTENRLHSMAIMHELLNESTFLLEINMQEYLHRVLEFHQNVLESRPELKMEVHIEPVKFPSKIALSLALIVNELATNAFKYAFPQGRSGEIAVQLVRVNDANTWKLTVSDNGIGLPDEYLKMLKSSTGLGCQLVNIMVDQIEGTLHTQNEGGAGFEIVFSV